MKKNRRSARRSISAAEMLESRRLLATITVTNTSDADGMGTTSARSLRQAINFAASTPTTADTIVFNFAGSGPFSITPLGVLNINSPVTIDATSEQLSNGTRGVEIDGLHAGTTVGININSNDVTLRGLAINRFEGTGVVIYGDNTIIAGCYIGTDATGTIDKGNGFEGITINSANNLIGGTGAGDRNIISGNGENGIIVNSAQATGNQINGNYIGTNVSGTAALPNDLNGVLLHASGNKVGYQFASTGSAARNVISGNGQDGVRIEQVLFGQQIFGPAADNNRVAGNYIGSNAIGSAAIPNGGNGVQIINGSNNVIGSNETKNYISGNAGRGVNIASTIVGDDHGDSRGNRVIGNMVGIRPGTLLGFVVAMPNTRTGVVVEGLNSRDNLIGGTAAGEGNVVSGNGAHGIACIGDSQRTVIQGNFVGSDPTGTSAIANDASGVYLNDSIDNVVGGSTAAARNILSGNGDRGIYVYGPAIGQNTNDNIIQGNYIGVNAAGTAALPNQKSGILIEGIDARDIEISGGNVISGNGSNGVAIIDKADANVFANFIGTDRTGNFDLGNTENGVLIQDAGGSRIGATPGNGLGNVISGNGTPGDSLDSNGVMIVTTAGGTAQGNGIYANMIGLNAAGTAALGNGDNGVLIRNATGNGVGASGAGNRIGGNTLNGISVENTAAGTASQTVIYTNYIGLGADGATVFANGGDGIHLVNVTQLLIGNITADARNVIAGNTRAGISIVRTVAATGGDGNLIYGNYVGTDATGLLARPNGTRGIEIINSGGNRVGSGDFINTGIVNSGNVISGNTGDGVYITSTQSATPAVANIIQSNLIGLKANGQSALGNGGQGINVAGASVTQTQIGGTTAPSRNVISGNAFSGVAISLGGSSVIEGNYIGTNAAATAAVPNGGSGVSVINAPQTRIGAVTAAGGNLISGNGGDGIFYIGSAVGLSVFNNRIGTDPTGGLNLANGSNGIEVNGDSPLLDLNATIGGIGAENVIRFNNGDGVAVTAGRGVTVSANTIRDNGGLGIDLGPNGVTMNDAGDADSGANDLQNFPQIGSVSFSGGMFHVSGALQSAASQTYRVEFFGAAAADPTFFGEGGAYLGFVNVTTDTAGAGTFNVDLPAASATAFATATATNESGSTSEFSQAISVGLDVTPPTVTAAAFTFETAQKAMVTFSENVAASLQTSDFIVENLTTSQTLPPTTYTITNAGNVATLNFSNLADGNYRVTVVAAGISDASGNTLDGDNNGVSGGNYQFAFYVLAADANRDRTVNINDFAILASNFNQANRTFSQGDFNYSGSVTIQDFAILASRFNTSLPAPAALPRNAPFGSDRRTPAGTVFSERLIQTSDTLADQNRDELAVIRMLDR